MRSAFGFVMLVAIFAAYWGYGRLLINGFRPRTVVTSLGEAELRQIFERTVASSGWKSGEREGKLVAQSPLVTGIRQQIVLIIEPELGGRTKAQIRVLRYSHRYGTPTKAHTLRLRINSFVSAVQKTDTTATIDDGVMR